MTAGEAHGESGSVPEAAVLYETHDCAAWITFNRPAQLNALNLDVAHGFRDAVARAVRDDDIRVVVLRSTGRSFVAGGDLAFLRTASDKSGAALALIEPIHAALAELARSPKIVIGSVKGAVAGAGMSLALNVDLLIAADDAVFNLAYARIGAPPDCGGSWALARLVGQRRALAIALLSENLGAGEALSLGLVNKVVPREALESETAALVARLVEGASVAQGHIKELIRSAENTSFEAQLAREAVAFAACARTRDFDEGISAFTEKRKADFRGC